jgi:hypothetical protein
MRQYRNHADEIDIDVLDEFYDSGEIPKPEDLTADELEDEMDFWQSAEEWEVVYESPGDRSRTRA